MKLPLLPTTVVGSYPQPDWLVDRAMLSKVVPRTRLHEMWRLPAEHLEQAQDDATVVAIRDMERAGIDIGDVVHRPDRAGEVHQGAHQGADGAGGRAGRGPRGPAAPTR